MAYLSIKDILIDALKFIPAYKSYFTGMFIEKPGGYVIKFNPTLNKAVRQFAENEPEYFDELDYFINVYCAPFYNNKTLSPSIFNRIICLAVIMPDIVEFLQRRKAEITMFKMSQAFLAHASFSKVSKDFFPHLAFLLLTDEIDYKLTTIKDKTTRDKMEVRLNALRTLAVKSFMVLDVQSKMLAEELGTVPEGIKNTDIYSYKNEGHGLDLFEGQNAKVVIILGDRGTGKTIGLLRTIYAILNMGYTVIIFGNDLRKELRFASFKADQRVNQTMYQEIRKYGDEPKGLPLTIYCDSPEFPIEKNIVDFKGTKAEWAALSGVVLFESEIVDKREDVTSTIVDPKTGKTRHNVTIIKTHRLSKIIDSFMRWRAMDRTKKVVLALNEAQRFMGSVVDKETWGLFHDSEKLFTEIRGLSVPVIMNTQYITRLKKSGQQFDELFASTITNPDERKKVADVYNIPTLRTWLSIPELKTRNHFFMVRGNSARKVKFLVPPCMPENNKFTLKQLFERTEPKEVTSDGKS
jgi:hypothetical protein